MVNKWNGELGSKVDDCRFRKDAFDAWLSWEFLQRGIAGKTTKMNYAEMGELCGKAANDVKIINRKALRKASSPTTI